MVKKNVNKNRITDYYYMGFFEIAELKSKLNMSKFKIVDPL